MDAVLLGRYCRNIVVNALLPKKVCLGPNSISKGLIFISLKDYSKPRFLCLVFAVLYLVFRLYSNGYVDTTT